jgi:hypothetical protein
MASKGINDGASGESHESGDGEGSGSGEIIPATRQKVKVRLPEGKKARKVQLLVAGRSPPVQEASGYLTFTVPSIDVHEVVAIDLV